ncbi:MAG: alpha/beta hydrolase [Pseudomonadota bacterium]|nr:alpha/beta hydrolase [Pseudomonadota bacterium]
MTKYLFAAVLAAMATPSLAAAAVAAPASAAQPSAIAAPARFSVEVVGSGPDVILIPGLSSSRAVWGATAERLKATHRLHLVQVRGFGEPAGANATGPVLQPFVDDVAAYIRREKIKSPAIVGHSMGGLAALMLAADHPDIAARIMVVDALPFIGTIFGADSVAAVTPQATTIRTMLLGQADKVAPDYQLKPDCPVTLPAPATPRGTMTNSGVGACLVAYGASVSDLRVVGQAMYDDMVTDMRPRLGRIATPVTMLYPHDDRLLTAKAAATLYGTAYAALPKAKLVPIANSYHFIMQDRPADFAAALDAFLK